MNAAEKVNSGKNMGIMQRYIASSSLNTKNWCYTYAQLKFAQNPRVPRSLISSHDVLKRPYIILLFVELSISSFRSSAQRSATERNFATLRFQTRPDNQTLHVSSLITQKIN